MYYGMVCAPKVAGLALTSTRICNAPSGRETTFHSFYPTPLATSSSAVSKTLPRDGTYVAAAAILSAKNLPT
jgi:hypothetical protein